MALRAKTRDLPTVAVVTGAARGIGLATSEALATAGVGVAMLDISREVESRAVGLRNARGYEVDVSDRERLQPVLEEIERELGAPQALINNAAVMALCRFDQLRPEVARRVIDVNLMGPFHAMQLVLPAMIASGRGHIINVSSAAGKWGIPGENLYVASKWALDGLGEVVRRELQHQGVSLSTVYMGPVEDTELSLGMKPTRLVRFSRPAEVAQAIVETLHHPRTEVWVPRQLGWTVRATQLMPRRVRESLQELAGVTRVATDVDRAARRPYDERAFGGSPRKEAE